MSYYCSQASKCLLRHKVKLPHLFAGPNHNDLNLHNVSGGNHHRLDQISPESKVQMCTPKGALASAGDAGHPHTSGGVREPTEMPVRCPLFHITK